MDESHTVLQKLIDNRGGVAETLLESMGLEKVAYQVVMSAPVLNVIVDDLGIYIYIYHITDLFLSGLFCSQCWNI